MIAQASAEFEEKRRLEAGATKTSQRRLAGNV
jgi:hypothetical protein